MSQRHLKACAAEFSGFFHAEYRTFLSQFFPLARHCRKAPRLPDPGLARSALDGQQKDSQTTTPLKKARAAKPRRTLKEITQSRTIPKQSLLARMRQRPLARAQRTSATRRRTPCVVSTKVLFRPAAQSGFGVKPVPEARLKRCAVKAIFCPAIASFLFLNYWHHCPQR